MMIPEQATSRRAGSPLSLQRIRTICSEVWLLASLLCGVFLLVALYTFSAVDPGWSHAAGELETVRNSGGVFGAWFADVILNLLGYPG